MEKKQIMNNKLSLLIPITETRYEDIIQVYNEYDSELEKLNITFEIIFIIDGEYPNITQKLEKLSESDNKIIIIKLARSFGEANAIMAASRQASGEVLLTLPAYRQIQPSEITKLVQSLNDFDLVVGCRNPRIDSKFNQIQARVFQWVVNKMSDFKTHDIGCGARVFKKKVLDEVQLYGDQHRFLALLAYRQGFKVKEVNLRQSEYDKPTRIHPFGVYLRRLLDILTVFFLTKFTKKPLRFFGLIGSFTFLIGVLGTLFLIFEKFFFGIALAERPALLISTLFMVLGVQVVAIGLLGEIIIFTHAKNIKEYTIEKIIGR